MSMLFGGQEQQPMAQVDPGAADRAAERQKQEDARRAEIAADNNRRADERNQRRKRLRGSESLLSGSVLGYSQNLGPEA